MITTEDAVVSLRPGAQFVIADSDISTLVWVTQDVEPLTSAEVQAEVKRLEKAAADETAAKEAAKASALAKLQALGLTEAEAAAIAGL